MSTPQPTSPEAKRVAGVIVTHGHLAGELLAAAEMIFGPISHIAAVSIGWHDDVDAARDEVQRAINRVTQGTGVLLLTDMFGGTPTNIASMFLEEGVVEVVTGVNLPMVIKLARNWPSRMSMTSAARVMPFSSSSFMTRRPKVASIVTGRLSTQKYPRSWKAFVSDDMPEPLRPVMITISGALCLLAGGSWVTARSTRNSHPSVCRLHLAAAYRRRETRGTGPFRRTNVTRLLPRSLA